jgi:hypothetical protein
MDKKLENIKEKDEIFEFLVDRNILINAADMQKKKEELKKIAKLLYL